MAFLNKLHPPSLQEFEISFETAEPGQTACPSTVSSPVSFVLYTVRFNIQSHRKGRTYSSWAEHTPDVRAEVGHPADMSRRDLV